MEVIFGLLIISFAGGALMCFINGYWLALHKDYLFYPEHPHTPFMKSMYQSWSRRAKLTLWGLSAASGISCLVSGYSIFASLVGAALVYSVLSLISFGGEAFGLRKLFRSSKEEQLRFLGYASNAVMHTQYQETCQNQKVSIPNHSLKDEVDDMREAAYQQLHDRTQGNPIDAWIRYVSEQHSFVASFPTTPHITRMPERIDGVRQTVYMSDSGAAMVSVAISETPQDMMHLMPDPRRHFEMVLAEFSSDPTCSIIDFDNSGEFLGNPSARAAVTQTLDGESFIMPFFLTMKDGCEYRLVSASPLSSIAYEGLNTLIGSFQFVGEQVPQEHSTSQSQASRCGNCGAPRKAGQQYCEECNWGKR